MRFESAAIVLPKCKLKYFRISECPCLLWALLDVFQTFQAPCKLKCCGMRSKSGEFGSFTVSSSMPRNLISGIHGRTFILPNALFPTYVSLAERAGCTGGACWLVGCPFQASGHLVFEIPCIDCTSSPRLPSSAAACLATRMPCYSKTLCSLLWLDCWSKVCQQKGCLESGNQDMLGASSPPPPPGGGSFLLPFSSCSNSEDSYSQTNGRQQICPAAAGAELEVGWSATRSPLVGPRSLAKLQPLLNHALRYR